MGLIAWVPGGSALVKNLPAHAGGARDLGSIPGSGRSPGGGHATHSSILAWRLPGTEEPGWLQALGFAKTQTGLSTHPQ